MGNKYIFKVYVGIIVCWISPDLKIYKLTFCFMTNGLIPHKILNVVLVYLVSRYYLSFVSCHHLTIQCAVYHIPTKIQFDILQQIYTSI